jgi:hypothetical protein
MSEVEELLILRKWLETAKELHASCQNPDVFAARFAEQDARYRALYDALFPKPMSMRQLVLKRAAVSRLSGEWSEGDYDVMCEGAVVGRIMKAAAPVGQPWLWTLAYGYHEDRTPTHGYEPTREAAMAAFAKSWRRE